MRESSRLLVQKFSEREGGYFCATAGKKRKNAFFINPKDFVIISETRLMIEVSGNHGFHDPVTGEAGDWLELPARVMTQDMVSAAVLMQPIWIRWPELRTASVPGCRRPDSRTPGG